jgi:hypothetical protein
VKSANCENIGDEAGAEALRCQVLRLLDPPKDEMNPYVTEIKAIAKSSRVFASTQLAKGIVTEFSKAIQPEKVDEALHALIKLVERAADLSWHLWTRKARLRLYLPANTYSSSSTDIEAHPLHVGVLDDDPKALDGVDYVLLCSGVVWMQGTAEGRDFGSSRLIKKAVAWMG